VGISVGLANGLPDGSSAGFPDGSAVTRSVGLAVDFTVGSTVMGSNSSPSSSLGAYVSTAGSATEGAGVLILGVATGAVDGWSTSPVSFAKMASTPSGDTSMHLSHPHKQLISIFPWALFSHRPLLVRSSQGRVEEDCSARAVRADVFGCDFVVWRKLLDVLLLLLVVALQPMRPINSIINNEECLPRWFVGVICRVVVVVIGSFRLWTQADELQLLWPFSVLFRSSLVVENFV